MSESRGRAFALAISVLMVITGSLNTICAKWADSLKAEGVAFNHPFLQATCMFFGEFLCLVAFFVIYNYKKYRWNRANVAGDSGSITDITSDSEPQLPQFNPLVFLPPACCDILATSIMYIGLNLTTASSFQMLRGAVIVFTGLLSVGMLGARIQGFKWIGMIFVILGLVVVGVTDIIYDDDPLDDKNAIITGNLLIIMAQIIVAIQMVYEQKYLNQYDVPALFAVGLEGLFGMTILSVLMVPMYYIHVPHTFSTNPEGRLEDVFFAWKEICEQPWIAVALGGTIISIAFFNFAGVSVTKELSATTRMVLDSVRTLVIWMFSIPLFGEIFIPVQLLGFALLILGMFVYNDILIGPWFRRRVLPNMGESHLCTRCCFSICGADMDETDRDSLLNEEQ
ncbi:transmembrane protein C2orf18 family protein [Ancylostoma caninum]|uniref:Transmembrane protein C2orf18 family protein n=1 Tax=Ancylostoma caninum TaxID=29170 RepID=A0A368G7M3_ANCCA|nr:transmembrane protein C2orf18 family protein [Ancylostoma caninum]